MKRDQMRYAEAIKYFYFSNLPTFSKFCFMIIHTPKSKTFFKIQKHNLK